MHRPRSHGNFPQRELCNAANGKSREPGLEV
jgi:hypothetical protein